MDSTATASGTYASFALDGSLVYALVHTEVHVLDASSGSVLWHASPFNPRGPVLVDKHGNAFISWTGSSSAAGFISYDSSGSQRWQTFCHRSQNANYDVSAIAIDENSSTYAACYFWDSLWSTVTTKFPSQPTSTQPRTWESRACSVGVDPLTVRRAGRSTEDTPDGTLVVFGGCAVQNNNRASVVAFDSTNGTAIVEFRSFFGERALATAMAWDDAEGGRSLFDSAPPLFVFNDNGELCAFPFAREPHCTLRPAALPCSVLVLAEILPLRGCGPYALIIVYGAVCFVDDSIRFLAFHVHKNGVSALRSMSTGDPATSSRWYQQGTH